MALESHVSDEGGAVLTWNWYRDFLDFDAEVRSFVYHDAGETFFRNVERRFRVLCLSGRHGSWSLSTEARGHCQWITSL